MKCLVHFFLGLGLGIGFWGRMYVCKLGLGLWLGLGCVDALKLRLGFADTRTINHI